jgi:hypothetical protein
MHVLTGDPERPRVDHDALDLVGRMHGASAYIRTNETFDLIRPVWRNDQARALKAHNED